MKFIKNIKILKQLNFISIRGRVAFSIKCLEDTIIFLGYEKMDGWNLILSQLRLFTQVQFLDEWEEIAVEYNPDVILSFDLYDRKEFEYLSKEDFLILKNLYKSVDESCCKIIDTTYHVGTINMYGSLMPGYGRQSLDKVKDIIDIMYSKSIPLPNIECFKKYNFSEDGGWGNKFIYDEEPI